MEKRMNRDPYADWWDKQDRRNYGEPCHEDHDILGALALHDYNHFTPGWGGVLFGTFVVVFLGVCGATSLVYPDKISVPKQYEGGLEAELGGRRAVRVSVVSDVVIVLANVRRRRSLAMRWCGNINCEREVICMCVRNPVFLSSVLPCL
jgi:NADH dehydrogenase (ubiquinone) 1 beta subcomplex subunit 8